MDMFAMVEFELPTHYLPCRRSLSIRTARYRTATARHSLYEIVKRGLIGKMVGSDG